jgi:hypothetical protein
MKSNKNIIFAVILVTLFLTGCEITSLKESEEEYLAIYNRTIEIVDDINENSDFAGLKLLAVSNGEDRGYGYGQYEEVRVTETEDVYGYYDHYPADSAERYLFQIIIESTPYHIYGITVGQDIDKAREVLTDKGFIELERDILYNDDELIVFGQDDAHVSISVSKDNDVITDITVTIWHDNAESEFMYFD